MTRSEKNASNKAVFEPKFKFGGLAITPGVGELIDSNDLDVFAFLRRHITGDWGDIPDADKESNEEALSNNGRLFSAYDLPDLPVKRLWVITEADRSVTTLLLPSEY